MAEELTTSLEELKGLLDGTTVAVVEPDEDVRALSEESLRRIGRASVLGSRDGEEVLEAVKAGKKIDAVVADSLVVKHNPGVWDELSTLLANGNIPLILLGSEHPKTVDQVAARTKAKVVIDKVSESYHQNPPGMLIKTVAKRIEMAQTSLG